MMRAAVRVPLEPNFAPVKASIAAPIDTSPKGAGVGSTPRYTQPVSAATFLPTSSATDLGQCSGQIGGSGCGVPLVLEEDLANHIGAFKADSELATSTGVIGTGKEGS